MHPITVITDSEDVAQPNIHLHYTNKPLDYVIDKNNITNLNHYSHYLLTQFEGGNGSAAAAATQTVTTAATQVPIA